MPVGEQELTARVTFEKSRWSDGGHCTRVPPEEFDITPGEALTYFWIMKLHNREGFKPEELDPLQERL